MQSLTITTLTDSEILELLTTEDTSVVENLHHRARAVTQSVYGDNVFARGLIEISSFCRNNCYYCGLRRDNSIAERYRLTPETIIEACDNGYSLGLRSFVLQGGEDFWFRDQRLAEIVRTIKSNHPDVAVTLSVGEQDKSTYRLWREAGADRYLLRHETADPQLYYHLHPQEMSYDNRLRCLSDLKDLGYQTGCGFMVDAPGCTTEGYLKDIRLIEMLQPAMVGIGPFIPATGTPFGNCTQGSAEMTLRLLSVIRLTCPNVLLPATTALDTILEDGMERGVLAGANVVMPNITPMSERGKYSIYNNKHITGSDAAESLSLTSARLSKIGRKLTLSRGDFVPYGKYFESIN